MKHFIYSGLTCCCLLYTSVFAQESKDVNEDVSNNREGKAISVSFHPLFLFNKAIKVDVELQKTKKPLAFILGGELYSGHVNSLYKQKDNFGETVNDKIAGLGINLALKYKFEETGRLSSFYISPGITYRHLNVKLNGPMFYSYMDDGIEYYGYGQAEKTIGINPIVFYGNIGRYIEIESFVVDFYFGMGYKALKQNKELLNSREYDAPMYGYNYQGYIFQIGFKVGWQLTK